MRESKFGTICPEVKKEKAPPLVLLGNADAYDLVVVEILISYNPNTIFVVLISWNSIITLRPNKTNHFDVIKHLKWSVFLFEFSQSHDIINSTNLNLEVSYRAGNNRKVDIKR